MTAWMRILSQRQKEAFAKAGVEMTIGGEPTFLPLQPDGAEWNYSAVGPTKYRYARRLAIALLRDHLKGGVDFFSPGKSYPGEVNPRWAIRIIANRDGTPIIGPRPGSAPTKASLAQVRKLVASSLRTGAKWKRLPDPLDPKVEIWALLIDEAEGNWKTLAWPAGRL